MRLAVDSNIIISALIRNGMTRELIYDRRLQLYTSSFAKEEIFAHMGEILKKALFPQQEIEEVLINIIENIKTIETLASWEKAEQISPDPNDIAYLALALDLQCPLWSNDKALKNQPIVKVITTEELKKMLKDKETTP
jgi:predicted nucleic acid-binding protein